MNQTEVHGPVTKSELRGVTIGVSKRELREIVSTASPVQQLKDCSSSEVTLFLP